MSKKTLLIGITGGVGAGKSTVSSLLRKEGYPVLSADEFAREVTKPGSQANQEIAAKIGQEFISAEGEILRSELRKKITLDPLAREKLNSIMHPKIQALTKKETERLFNEGNTMVFYEAPLLFEAKSATAMDLVVCVAADDPVRIDRIMKRDNVSKEEAAKLLASQLSQNEKIDRSDFVIWNNEDAGKLNTLVEKILIEIKHRIR